MTGQSISAMGVWNIIQILGDKVCEDEHKLIEAHKVGQVKGDKEALVLFEKAVAEKIESCQRLIDRNGLLFWGVFL